MNLPPFYIGQKIVSLANFDEYRERGFNTPVKGVEYTVRNLRQVENKWCVDLVEVKNNISKFAGGLVGEVTWVCRWFKGIEPLTTKLELTKVLEKVNEFVFTN
jgi:hypothetical protein